MKKWIAIGLLLYGGCSGDTQDTQPPVDKTPAVEGVDPSRIIGYAPNGLPVVASEELPPSAVSETSQAITTEPFYCLDEYWGAGPYRVNDYVFGVHANASTDFYPTGEAGEGSDKFSCLNRFVNRRIAAQPGTGGIEWHITPADGSHCTSDPGSCSYYVCVINGNSADRCIGPVAPWASSNEWQNDNWPANSWKNIEVFFQVNWGGPANTRLDNVYISHTPK